MWIYTKDAFYSVVEDHDHPAWLIVRARVEGDIERLWPRAQIERDAGTDYAFRARIDRGTVSRTLAQAVRDIDYPNFKDAVTDDRRSDFYSQIWTVAWHMQQALRGA